MLKSELWALLYGLQLCQGLNVKLECVESDSMILVNMLNRRKDYTWSDAVMIGKIACLLQDIKISHIPKEKNSMADKLAKLVHYTGNRIFGRHDEIPNTVKALINLEKQGVPCFRM